MHDYISNCQTLMKGQVASPSLVCAIIMMVYMSFTGIPIPHLPKYDSFPIDSLLVRRQQRTFLLGIFCSWENGRERSLIRRTMLGKHFQSIVSRKLCSLNQFLSDDDVQKTCQILYTFVIGGNASADHYFDPDQQLTVENYNNSQELDLTILNINENMNEGKTPSWFYFSSQLLFNAIDYVAKCDLDTFISIPSLIKFIDLYLPSRENAVNPRIYGGIFYDSVACGGPAYEQCRKMEKKFFMSGQFYFVSHDIVMMRHLWMKSFSTVPFEDVDFGLRLWHANISFNSLVLNAVPFWVHLLKNENEYLSVFTETKNNSWKLIAPQLSPS